MKLSDLVKEIEENLTDEEKEDYVKFSREMNELHKTEHDLARSVGSLAYFVSVLVNNFLEVLLPEKETAEKIASDGIDHEEVQEAIKKKSEDANNLVRRLIDLSGSNIPEIIKLARGVFDKHHNITAHDNKESKNYSISGLNNIEVNGKGNA